MIQSLVRCNLLLIATAAFAQSMTPSIEAAPMKQALIGKIAYTEGNWQTANTALFQLAQQQELDTPTYLQLFATALSMGQEKELLALSQSRQYQSPLYQKSQVILQLYLNQNVASAQWQLLDKKDWVAFFARIPSQHRLSFLEKVYQPEMINAPSARAFMIEMLFVIGLSDEALELSLFPVEHANTDLVHTYAQLFPAGLSPNLLAPLCQNASSDVRYTLAHTLMQLQEEQQLHSEVDKMLRLTPWSLEQRFSLARTAIACGHSAAVWAHWEKSDFLEGQQLLLQMGQCCYDEDWEALNNLLSAYHDKNDDFYLYYKAQLLAHNGEVERAIWAIDRIAHQELKIEAMALKTEIMIKENPAQAMVWAKQLVDAQTWGPRELGVLQAKLMFHMGYEHEARALLEQLVEQEMGYAPAIKLLSEYYLQQENGVEKAAKLMEKYHFKEDKAARLLQQRAMRAL